MISMRTKSMFFDRPAVIKAMDDATGKVFRRFGGAVRLTARRSIVKRKTASFPGRPPSSHIGTLKRSITFIFSRMLRSVIIGPERMNKIGDAPHALEHGGFSTIATSRFFGRRRGKEAARGRILKRVRIKQRPFMGPAFEKEKRGLSRMWADSIR